MVCTEQQFTAVSKRGPHVSLCSAAVAAIKGRQLVDRLSLSLCCCRSHDDLPLQCGLPLSYVTMNHPRRRASSPAFRSARSNWHERRCERLKSAGGSTLMTCVQDFATSEIHTHRPKQHQGAPLSSEYSARHLSVLEGLEAVRKRPGMYIGSTDSRGLMHCLWEIIDNSCLLYTSDAADE